MKKQYLKNKKTCKVTFCLPKEATSNAKKVVITGDFTKWNTKKAIPMKPNKKGEYTAELELKPGKEYQFRYIIDNERWENDWSADKYVPSGFEGVENSVVCLTNVEVPSKKKGTAKATKVTSTRKMKSTATKGVKVKSYVADDLRKIEGVGPKIASLLNNEGIYTYKQLAKASSTKLNKVLEAAGSRYKAHDPTSWPQQAKLAAKNDWTELKAVQVKLKNGRN